MNKSYWAHVFRQRMMEAKNDGGGTPEGNNDKPNEAPIPFEELLKNNPAYQSEFDRRMSKGLDTAKMKWQEETQKQVSEAEKLAKMTANERMEHMHTQRENALKEREEKLFKRELETLGAHKLMQKGLPESLKDALNYKDEACLNQSIDHVEKAFFQAVQQGIEMRLQGNTPKMGASTQNLDLLTDKEYYQMMKKQNLKGNE